MTREGAIEYWEGLRKTFSSQLEKEENHFGRMHLQTTIDAIDMAISALRQQETVTDRHQMTNADRIRVMSDEELAEMLWKTGRNYRAVCADPVVDHDEQCAELVKWIQQPVEIEEA